MPRGVNRPVRLPAGPLATSVRWWLATLGVCLGGSGVSEPLRADYRNAFESAEVSWRLADADCPVRLAAHQRDQRLAHSGHASEHVAVTAGRGTYVYLVHDIDRSRVIAEWRPSLWVHSDRPGMQLMARVVLPRARDPRSGAALTTLLRGDIYDRPGAWQQLWIHRPDQLLERQVRVLRSEFGPDIDDREAYVDLIVLNAYGGVGTSSLWLDDLEIAGQVPAQTTLAAARSESPSSAEPPASQPAGRSEVRLKGSVLVADGAPLFPRVIDANGESLEWLRSLGFNVIRFRSEPTSLQLHEAQRLNLWLVAPPPANGLVSADHDRVLAWDLGSDLSGEHLESVQHRIAAVRKADPHAERPLIAEASQRVWSYSRLASFLVMRASPLGTSQSLPRYAQWLEERATLARPGTPFWAAVQTEWPAALLEQWSALGLGSPMTLAVEPEQVRQLAYQAIASGARGLIFSSRTPLDGADADSQSRARTLRQLNLELQTIEPWAAAGTRQAPLETGRSDLRASILQTERAQLLMVLSQDPHQQFTRGPSAPGPFSVIIPSPVNSPQVYRLAPGGLQLITHRRVAGGIRLVLEELQQVNLIAISQDPLVLNHLARSLGSTKSALAGLARETAARELELVETIHRVASGPAPPSAADAWLGQARANLRHCELLLGASDPGGACQFADKALESLGQLRRIHWDSAAGTFASPLASPYCVCLSALPLHYEMARRLQANPQWSGNLLAGGDFENLAHLRASGWQNYATPTRDLSTVVELSNQSPQAGSSALRIAASSATEAPVAFESPPVTIVSAPVPVRRGQLLRVSGWIRIPEPIRSSVDGLKIHDSLGGDPLALRIYETSDWQQFAYYRGIPQDGSVEVTFEMTGVGEAWIDGVEMSVHESISPNDPALAPSGQVTRVPSYPSPQ